MILRAATVALNDAWTLANATAVDVTDDSPTPKFRMTKQHAEEYQDGRHEMQIQTKRCAMQATNQYFLIQEYIRDAKEFASRAESVCHDSSAQLRHAANAAWLAVEDLY